MPSWFDNIFHLMFINFQDNQTLRPGLSIPHGWGQFYGSSMTVCNKNKR